MIRAGNATIFVSDFQRSLRFYTEVLGLELRLRAGDHWAEVAAGTTLVLGLHPRSENHPDPGTAGSIELGLQVEGTLEPAIAHLRAHGVELKGDVLSDPNAGLRFQYFRDPDGTVLYLWEDRGTNG